MNSRYTEILEKQLMLLFEQSKQADISLLPNLTDKIIQLAKLLDPDLRSQSVCENPNPYVGHLSMSDLEALAQARREHARRRAEEERQWSIDHGVSYDPT